MKIEITFDENCSTSAGWTVTQGDKYADHLAYEEMLGLVAAMTMPAEKRPCLQWLRTKEEHEEWLNNIRSNAQRFDNEESN